MFRDLDFLYCSDGYRCWLLTITSASIIIMIVKILQSRFDSENFDIKAMTQVTEEVIALLKKLEDPPSADAETRLCSFFSQFSWHYLTLSAWEYV